MRARVSTREKKADLWYTKEIAKIPLHMKGITLKKIIVCGCVWMCVGGKGRGGGVMACVFVFMCASVRPCVSLVPYSTPVVYTYTVANAFQTWLTCVFNSRYAFIALTRKLWHWCSSNTDCGTYWRGWRGVSIIYTAMHRDRNCAANEQIKDGSNTRENHNLQLVQVVMI